MKTLIVDCGSTSARWALHDSDRPDSPVTIITAGFNASALNVDEIKRVIAPAAEVIRRADAIRFYGAGCRPGAPSERVAEALSSYVLTAKITVWSDIYASIHAVAPEDDAIVAIAGTGVNAVAVSRGEIIDAVTSTGYILGDFGSGAALGRSLMEMYVSGRLSETLRRKLEEEYDLSPSSVIDSVYRGSNPRSFLGSFARFLLSNASEPEVDALLREQFGAFVKLSLLPLLERHNYDIRLTGSIAYYFRSYIEEALSDLRPEARITAVAADPILHIRP